MAISLKPKRMSKFENVFFFLRFFPKKALLKEPKTFRKKQYILNQKNQTQTKCEKVKISSILKSGFRKVLNNFKPYFTFYLMKQNVAVS
jgi:hypothetical protein